MALALGTLIGATAPYCAEITVFLVPAVYLVIHSRRERHAEIQGGEEA